MDEQNNPVENTVEIIQAEFKTLADFEKLASNSTQSPLDSDSHVCLIKTIAALKYALVEIHNRFASMMFSLGMSVYAPESSSVTSSIQFAFNLAVAAEDSAVSASSDYQSLNTDLQNAEKKIEELRERITTLSSEALRHRRLLFVERAAEGLKHAVRHARDVKRNVGPSGRVTLMFTDVEGSTELWQAFPDTMRVALSVHDEVMRDAIARCKGFEVKTEGDAFMIAFSSCIDALECAVTMQERLVVADWPPELLAHPKAARIMDDSGSQVLYRGLRVRIGFNTGEPEVVVDHTTGRTDYYGPVVNASARVAAQADGGEIVIPRALVPELALEAEARNYNLRSRVLLLSRGVADLKGIGSMELCTLIPASLAGRRFWLRSKGPVPPPLAGPPPT